MNNINDGVIIYNFCQIARILYKKTFVLFQYESFFNIPI